MTSHSTVSFDELGFGKEEGFDAHVVFVGLILKLSDDILILVIMLGQMRRYIRIF